MTEDVIETNAYSAAHREAVRALDDMIAIVSHDLRSPLQSISTATSMLQLDRSGASRQRSMESIEAATAQIDRLLRDLLDISHVEAGRLGIETSVEDVASLIEEAEALFDPLAREKSVRFVCSCEDDMPPLSVDRDRMLQALSNLLGNAIKFVSEHGRIELAARHAAGRVRIAVSDDGAGIAAGDIKRVFDRFWCGAQTRRAGTGLGLAVAKGIVEAHGGVLGVESRRRALNRPRLA